MLQSVVQPLVRRVTDKGSKTLIQRAIASLRARGTDAHLWLPGVGTVNGLTTGNYLESTGNSIATVDNPTGLVLDALGSVGSELVTNGDFSNGLTGWTHDAEWGVSAGSAVCSVTAKNLQQSILTVDKTYEIRFTLSSGSIGVYVGYPIPVIQFSTVGSHRIIVKAQGNTVCTFQTQVSTLTTIDNISVREVTGIHLTQATTANKAVLRRGLTNLLTYSSDFSNASWVKDGGTLPTITVNAGAAPNGEITADRVVLNKTGVDYSRVYQRTGGIVGQAYTQAYWLKTYSGGSSNVGFRLDQTGINIVVTSDWTLFVLSTTNTSTGLDSQIILWDAISGNDETADILIGGAALFQGTLTASQILAAGGIPVTTSAAASNPDAGRYSWSCDSTDLLTATFPAGYESVTVIDAKSTGQVTTAAANIVGSYSIGPSYTSYGRIIIKGSITASELALYQGFANKLAGL